MNLNTSEWKEFLLSDYFEIYPGKYHGADEYGEGNTPYISASNENNGVAKKISLSPEFDGNCIITGKVGCTAFYQKKPFCATSDVNIYQPKFEMSEKVGLFLTTIINYSENYKWAYGRQCRVGNSKRISVRLPATPDGEPDWQFMEDYIKSLHHKPLTTRNKTSKAPVLNTQDWKEFVYTDIFKLKGGFYNKKPEHSIDGDIPFLASTDSNNGVTEYYSLEDIRLWDKVGDEDNMLDKKLFEGNCIAVTVNGSVCNAYYQSDTFTCSHDITALYLKNHTLNPYIATFLCAVIMKEKYRWSYGRKPHDVKKFGKSIIKLPVDVDGNPDWQFMEDYIKSLPYGDRI